MRYLCPIAHTLTPTYFERHCRAPLSSFFLFLFWSLHSCKVPHGHVIQFRWHSPARWTSMASLFTSSLWHYSPQLPLCVTHGCVCVCGEETAVAAFGRASWAPSHSVPSPTPSTLHIALHLEFVGLDVWEVHSSSGLGLEWIVHWRPWSIQIHSVLVFLTARYISGLKCTGITGALCGFQGYGLLFFWKHTSAELALSSDPSVSVSLWTTAVVC